MPSNPASSSAPEQIQDDPATELRELLARQKATGEKEYGRCSTETCPGTISMEMVLTLEVLKATLESRTEIQKNLTSTANTFDGVLARMVSSRLSLAGNPNPPKISREEADHLNDWDAQITAKFVQCTARDRALQAEFDHRQTEFDGEPNLCSHLMAKYQPETFTGYDQFVPLEDQDVSWDDISTRWNSLKTERGVSAPVESNAAETMD
ncbi:hypothetical protein EHS25_000128 [Saitozyma podzolica]|uniref:Uncharacterized protein n=1 Tax=Saitozyma podzolica TaxID=1890683 RepID=A0A427YVD5_9TREE|nr:hypothetical protein EHS25_000128 [Saitozyma podzolica]